jgi:hypothetical protein
VGVRAAPFVVALTAVILAGAAYELADAAGWISLGNLPGEGPTGEGAVIVAAFAAMLVGGIYAALLAIPRTGTPPGWPWVLLPLAAGGFVGARYYAFDPYYLPELRRVSYGGGISGIWIVVILALSALAAALIHRRGRIGLPFVALVLVVCAFTALFERAGH